MKEETNIYAKLLKVKSEIGTLTKNASNPFFKSKYLDLSDLLEAVEPVLEKHGLVLLQPIHNNRVCTIILDTEHYSTAIDIKNSLARVQSEIELPAISDPQKLGSAISYFRRYTLVSLLSISQVDDDGNTASKAPQLKTLSDKKFGDAIAALEDNKITKEYLTSNFDLTAQQAVELDEFIKSL